MIKFLYHKLSRFIPIDVTRLLVWQPGTNSDSPLIQSIDLVLLQAADLQVLLDQPEYELDATVIASVDQASVVCIGAINQGEIAGYMFFCTSPVAPERNSGGSAFAGIGLEFPDNVRYLYKVLVLPAFRGKRLAPAMLTFAASHFQSQLVDTIVTTTDWTNTAFLRATHSVGFDTVATAAEIVVFGRRFFRIPPNYNAGDGVDANIQLTRPTKLR